MGKLVVVTGPSGAGKDSVIEQAHSLGLDFTSITTTSTRPMRPGEAEGKPHFFLTREEFEEKIDNGEMIEWAEVYDNLYGSSKTEVERKRKNNDVVLIKVDPQGARTFKEMIPDAITVFIKPPSLEYLEMRLHKRASDAEDVIQKRMEIAKYELEKLDSWDYVILNDEGKLEEAAQELIAIIST